ncbi:kinase-like domain-containing protein [Roridomyces roridus]|uniref:Kinase-like domain-containing protein n=1 Tax=Roridomyces roridus TaxID=1738132 RepID=A0AAD7B6S1_9AGAR|nr:kinase-like domain-containing protein [Roridomyces roridus]
MSFDYPFYLASTLSLPANDFQVDILTGGLTNLTARASFARPLVLFDLPQLFTSVILKYAPPFIASDPIQPMSVHRQVIEATALRYLAENARIQALLQEFPDIRIPQLIHHDTGANVLWITDLGSSSQMLSTFLASCSPENVTAIRENASAFGAFMAKFWDITAEPTPETLASLSRPEDPNTDAEELASRVAAAMQTKQPAEPCLAMVDFWTGSVLVGPGSSRGLVDWEYFGLSTSGAEIGMFVAHLHLLLQYKTSTLGVAEVVEAFLSAFLDAYAAHAPPSSQYLKRQALIAYGREMITAAEFFAAELSEEAQTRVVSIGVASLRAAGGSDNELSPQVATDSITRLWRGGI